MCVAQELLSELERVADRRQIPVYQLGAGIQQTGVAALYQNVTDQHDCA